MDKKFVVLHSRNIDNINKEYYFWTNLPKEEIYIINYKYISPKLKEILSKKFPKILKEIEKNCEDSDRYNSKARVWVEYFGRTKIKNL